MKSSVGKTLENLKDYAADFFISSSLIIKGDLMRSLILRTLDTILSLASDAITELQKYTSSEIDQSKKKMTKPKTAWVEPKKSSSKTSTASLDAKQQSLRDSQNKNGFSSEDLDTNMAHRNY